MTFLPALFSSFSNPKNLRMALGAAALLGLVAACGGGGGGGSSSPAASSIDRIEPLDSLAFPNNSLKDEAALEPLSAYAHLPAQLQLPALPDLAEQLQAEAEAEKGRVVGLGRALPQTADEAATAAQWQWHVQADGRSVGVMGFAASGAQALRLQLRLTHLPAGSVLRFYDAQGQFISSLSAAQWQALSTAQAQHYWSAEVPGERINLELSLPTASARQTLQLAVPQLAHIGLALEQDDSEQAVAQVLGRLQARASCMTCASCFPEQATQMRSVLRLRFVKANGKTYECSGTLLNDGRNSYTPYVLTAQHCIADQDAADSVSSYWFYWSAQCGDTSTPSMDASTVHGGADLLYSNASTDTALLRLRQPAPARALFAGSYFGPDWSTQDKVFSLHHPSGALLKLSSGDITGYANCSSNANGEGFECQTGSRNNSHFIQTIWSQGSTASGSSGAALLLEKGGQNYVIGQLLGGNCSCSNPDGRDYFGRFDRAMQDGLRTWLLPTEAAR